jgi:hypothetical protein
LNTVYTLLIKINGYIVHKKVIICPPLLQHKNLNLFF